MFGAGPLWYKTTLFLFCFFGLIFSMCFASIYLTKRIVFYRLYFFLFVCFSSSAFIDRKCAIFFFLSSSLWVRDGLTRPLPDQKTPVSSRLVQFTLLCSHQTSLSCLFSGLVSLSCGSSLPGRRSSVFAGSSFGFVSFIKCFLLRRDRNDLLCLRFVSLFSVLEQTSLKKKKKA